MGKTIEIKEDKLERLTKAIDALTEELSKRPLLAPITYVPYPVYPVSIPYYQPIYPYYDPRYTGPYPTTCGMIASAPVLTYGPDY